MPLVPGNPTLSDGFLRQFRGNQHEIINGRSYLDFYGWNILELRRNKDDLLEIGSEWERERGEGVVERERKRESPGLCAYRV